MLFRSGAINPQKHCLFRSRREPSNLRSTVCSAAEWNHQISEALFVPQQNGTIKSLEALFVPQQNGTINPQKHCLFRSRREPSKFKNTVCSAAEWNHQTNVHSTSLYQTSTEQSGQFHIRPQQSKGDHYSTEQRRFLHRTL